MISTSNGLLRWPVTVAFLLVALVFFSVVCDTRQKNDLKIGVILPLTGDGAKYGEEARNGIELALDQIGRDKIVLQYEDDLGTAQGAVAAFNKFTSDRQIPLILGMMYSSTALAVAPLAQERKVVVFSVSASSPVLTTAGNYFFRNWPSDVFEGGEMGRFAYDALHLRTVAILAVNLDYGVGLTSEFSDTFASRGGEVLITEFYEQGSTDFRSSLTKIRELSPDALYLPGYYAEIGLAIRQAKELGLKCKILSCVGFDNPKVIEIAGNAVNEVIFSRPYFDPKSTDKLVEEFVSRYTQNHEIMPGIYAAHAYDAMRIVGRAVLSFGATTPDSLRAILHLTKQFPGVTGATTIDENGDVIKPIQFMKVEHKEFIPYD